MNERASLDYENPKSDPPDYSYLVRVARGAAGTGFRIPFVGLIGFAFGVAAWSAKTLPLPLRKQGRNAAMLGMVSLLINPLLCIAILLPSLGRARPAANVIKCSSNLRQIGLAVMMYANENGDQLPPDFAALLLTQDITSDVFVCPQSQDDRPVFVTSPTTQQVAAAVLEGTGTCSYFYYRFPNRKLANLSPRHVLAFEKASNHTEHGHVGMNILFADGQITWFPADQAQKIVSELATGQNPPPSAK